MIKTHFTQSLLQLNIPLQKNERGNVSLWQARFWEHRIRDDRDLQTHVDYIHYNPVKHGYVKKPTDWPYSTIHRFIKNGGIDHIWGAECWGNPPVLRLRPIQATFTMISNQVNKLMTFLLFPQ